MLSSITVEIPGKFNEDWFPTWDICLSKGICEINTLTLQTYNILQNQHQPHCGPLDHWRIRVHGFRRQYLLDIPSYTISCLGFPDCLIKFPLALERPCSRKHIVISNWLPWKNLPCVPSHKTLDFIIHFLELLIRFFIAIKIPIMYHIDYMWMIIFFGKVHSLRH